MFKPSFIVPLFYMDQLVGWDIFTVNSFPEADPPVECRAYLDATNEFWMKFFPAVFLYTTLLCVLMGIYIVERNRDANHKFAMELAEATPEEREERLQMICRANGSKARLRENAGGEKGDMLPGN